ncbi:pan, partial [Drosophila simulans]
ICSDFPFRFSPSLLPSVHATSHHVINAHTAIVGVSSKQECGVQDPTTNRYPRRKKKCIRYMEALNGNGPAEDGSCFDEHGSQLSDDDEDDYDDDKLGGSCGSADETNKIEDEDSESLNQSMPSPGCLSGLSSLQSPSTTMSLASPLNMNANSATNVIFPASSNAVLIVGADQSTVQQRPTLVSTSGSSSGSTSSISTTPNTSSTVSPVTCMTGPCPGSSQERAMMLGNRFSHLGMGLSPPVVSTSTSKSEPFFKPHPTVSNNPVFSLPSIGNCSLNISSMPNTSRNPIGANPRDINNPLSINQLTKRRDYKNVDLIEASESKTIVAHAASSIIQHVAVNGYHANHSLLNSNLSQLHHQLNSRTEKANRSEQAMLSVSNHSVNSNECHKESDSQAIVSSNPPNAGSSDNGVIFVSSLIAEELKSDKLNFDVKREKLIKYNNIDIIILSPSHPFYEQSPSNCAHPTRIFVLFFHLRQHRFLNTHSAKQACDKKHNKQINIQE